VFGGGSCGSLNCVNFSLLASSFLARAAVVSNVTRGALESGLSRGTGLAAEAVLSLRELDANV
jgi:hypothetical protein